METEVMPNFLLKRAFLTPERTALYFEDKTLTFNELYHHSYEVAGKLQALGIKKDDYIGVLLKNHLETVIILFALQLLGVKAVILNNRLTAAELAWQVNDSKVILIIHELSFLNLTSEIHEQLQGLQTITKENLMMTAGVPPELVEEVSLNDVCTIMYTSGTTGHPKGVMQSYGNHWWSSVGSALNLGFMDTDCWLCSVPLFHISGFSILMRSIIYGMPIVLHESFDVEKTFKDIEDKHVTIMSVVGTMLKRMIDTLGETKLPKYFRCMLLGGGPAPLPLLQSCVEKNIPVFQTYGMTETSSQIVTLSPEYSLTKLGSAGKPLFPSQIRIEGDNGESSLPGIAGEIVVKGPNVTKGYLYRPDATERSIRQGWLYTGDIGYLDKEGFLFVLDRRSDLIISGGENVYPAEIEAVLLSHPAVADAGVTGMDDSTWGQVPIAFIVKKEGTVLSADELIEFCQRRLAKYKVPKGIKFLDQLPRNAAKKLLRRKLLETGNQGSEQG